jgi:hypothetical protein
MKTKGKNPKTQDYRSLFIKSSKMLARTGKTAYIRKEHHDRIMKIVQVIGNNEVSIFEYMDNVLAHHFEHYKDEIAQLYKQNINTDIF